MTKLLLPLLLLGTAAHALELPATKPAKGTIHRWISLPASFAPWQQVDLKARVAGYIEKIAVDKGDVVTAQQKLIEISVPELEADLIGHRAQIAAAEIEVKRLHEARSKSPDLVLPQSVDDAEAKLAIARAGMERTNALIDLAHVKAPFSGTITDRRVDPGAYAAAGGDTLLQLTDTSTLRLQVPVIEIETSRLKVGQQVEAKVDALGGTVVKGSISRITGALDPSTRTMLIEADFKNEEGQLRPGMFATARVAVEQHDNTTIIPVGALVMEKTNAFVFKHVDGKAMKTAVKPGFNDGVNVEVPELKAGDVILVPGGVTLADKQDVTVK
ncbi:efflux RND transporter periplasmic adaptor subunit [Prosthecobacter sp.]|uniref:efflux RND transporter periplasmic adaptor subunit n=1 Tax=Prosthecobacter sp. TaxID=1965333 RepID=UPI001D3B0826|nr:efflux RND transporter periplasmic adaptor subunit [Prosthecobacter sp.]MCB1275924.1 efflux RND transporter periplasmic adaptor subunit [Prosthecobacter sp.]